MTLTKAKFKIVEVALAVTVVPIVFSLMNVIEGTGFHMTEFEVGAVTGIVALKLIEALRAVFD